MKKLTIWLTAFLIPVMGLRADEGMWLPLLLEKLNEKDMQAKGLKLSARDIYDINQSSLKDAIVHFGGGCTGELVSSEGLILTNHHCGFSEIQSHSTIENNYLNDGFWAMSRDEELPNPGLSVSFLVYMKDVTAEMTENLSSGMSESVRARTLSEAAKKIIQAATEGTHYEANIRPFFSGNEFYMMVYETFEDVRLVGAPPSSIGKFGGDTDNWMWPRHTGDFSVFRIYAGSDNKPAPYSPDNVPYKPRHFLPISLKGVEKGDFTFVYGFPGTTQEYLPAVAIQTIINNQNPVRIKLRGMRLGIMDQHMEQSELTRIQYAAKHAGIANGWKKWIGENRGIARMDAISKKTAYENRFREWANGGPYQTLLDAFEAKYKPMAFLRESEAWIGEAAFGVELLRLARSFNAFTEMASRKDHDPAALNGLKNRLTEGAMGFFKDYNPAIDIEVMAALLGEYHRNSGQLMYPPALESLNKKYKNNYKLAAGELFQKSMFADSAKLMKLLRNFKPRDAKKIQNDPAFSLAIEIATYYSTQIQPPLRSLVQSTDSLQRVYMKAQMEMEPGRLFYPDANSTLRITYGQVDDYYPRNAVHYLHYTTLDGIIEKENPGILDYEVHPRLKELWQKKDFGRYASSEGQLHVAFIGTNHTTGGNSGSPVLNGKGHLLGLNFDRNWEGTMSDLMYDPDMCRNITLDIRYCLFIIDKFAGAGHLLSEMTIIQ